ncbi:hypothetical protein VFPBJ_11471 [Purpureocillium lilacinum]|uniref:Uncharacterized protein n=1 Tax=Purpureocillium lilacinum TaxID=33203 RepID=A0A179F7A2_PURLI|nr:hypothetical protein VFPBJ_11471 [Purpureocillium lilacinum]
MSETLAHVLVVRSSPDLQPAPRGLWLTNLDTVTHAHVHPRRHPPYLQASPPFFCPSPRFHCIVRQRSPNGNGLVTRPFARRLCGAMERSAARLIR